MFRGASPRTFERDGPANKCLSLLAADNSLPVLDRTRAAASMSLVHIIRKVVSSCSSQAVKTHQPIRETTANHAMAVVIVDTLSSFRKHSKENATRKVTVL